MVGANRTRYHSHPKRVSYHLDLYHLLLLNYYIIKIYLKYSWAGAAQQKNIYFKKRTTILYLK
jgi:hypothetical protein